MRLRVHKDGSWAVRIDDDPPEWFVLTPGAPWLQDAEVRGPGWSEAVVLLPTEAESTWLAPSGWPTPSAGWPRKLREAVMEKRLRPTELELTCRFVDKEGCSIPGRFRWVASRPLEVEVIFQPPNGWRIPWVVGRDLLQEGMESVVGVGDVQMTPAPERGTLYLTLSSLSGRAVFRCCLHHVGEFLSKTMELCPRSAEQAAVDEALEEFLTSDWPPADGAP